MPVQPGTVHPAMCTREWGDGCKLYGGKKHHCSKDKHADESHVCLCRAEPKPGERLTSRPVRG